jgi:hypothetical protein
MGGAVVALAAAPALAASTGLTVSPTGTQNHNVVIRVSGSYDNSTSTSSKTVKLTVDKPNSSTATLYSGTANPLSSGSTPAKSVDTSALDLNGDYVFHFSVGSTNYGPQTVSMRVPPAKVGGFGASPSGTVAHFSWDANSEPDLAGYDLVDVTEPSNPRDLTPGGVGTNVCDSSGCSVDIDFGSGAQGSSRQFVIDALRYTSPSHSATLASGDSAPATVSFPTPPTSSGGSSGGGSAGGGSSSGGGSGSGGSGGTGTSTGGNTGGGSTGGGTGGSTGGGSTGGGTTTGSFGGGHTSGGNNGQGISADHPNVALKAYLPSFSAGAAPNLPSVVTEVKPLPEGTYKPTLAYPDQVVGETTHRQGAATTAVRDELVHVLNVAAVWKSLAGAVLVLLMAAHLRAWVAGVEND